MLRPLLAAAILAVLCAPPARAEGRLFGFTYEAEAPTPGAIEVEQSVTQYSGAAQGAYSRWQLAQELEVGFSRRLSGSLYLNFNDSYRSVNSPTGTDSQDSFSFDGLSTEWTYLIGDPEGGSLGLAFSFEPRYSGTELELEPRLIVSHDLGRHWAAALNVTPETEYGFSAGGQSMDGEAFLSAGLAWESGSYSAGLEAFNHRDLPNWGPEDASAWFAGPCLAYAGARGWVTLAVLPQVQGQPSTLPGDGRILDGADYAKVESRLLLGLDF